jgi:PilZ domain
VNMKDWLATFRQLHVEAKAGRLTPSELTDYEAGRDELARALLAAQRVMLKPGETVRRTLRVSKALQVDLEFGEDKVRGLTLDLSAGGFAMLLAKQPATNTGKFTLRMPGSDPLSGKLRIVEAKAQPGNKRISFAFVDLAREESERLETVVFDTVLAQMVG